MKKANVFHAIMMGIFPDYPKKNVLHARDAFTQKTEIVQPARDFQIIPSWGYPGKNAKRVYPNFITGLEFPKKSVKNATENGLMIPVNLCRFMKKASDTTNLDAIYSETQAFNFSSHTGRAKGQQVHVSAPYLVFPVLW